MASEVLGPLHGVPVTIKEAIQVAGMDSTWGNPAFRDFVAAKDVTVVRRLKQAGELRVRTTNVASCLVILRRPRTSSTG